MMKNCRLLLLIFISCFVLSNSSCGGAESSFQTPTLTNISRHEAVPSGIPPIIDGTMSPAEWEDAGVEYFADGSQLLLMQAGDFFYIGIRAGEPGMIAGNVFIQRGDEISILHSSAALGTAVYQQIEASWQQVKDFTWRCRNSGNSEAARAERMDFLEDENWLAANGRMGIPNELEYKIRTPQQDFSLAVVYIKSSYPYEKVPWPLDLEDDCIRPASGELPEKLVFSPAEWVAFEVSN